MVHGVCRWHCDLQRVQGTYVEEKMGLQHSENTRRRGGESGAFHYFKYLGSTVQSNGE